jgi:hypothetical protein
MFSAFIAKCYLWVMHSVRVSMPIAAPASSGLKGRAATAQGAALGDRNAQESRKPWRGAPNSRSYFSSFSLTNFTALGSVPSLKMAVSASTSSCVMFPLIRPRLVILLSILGALITVPSSRMPR